MEFAHISWYHNSNLYNCDEYTHNDDDDENGGRRRRDDLNGEDDEYDVWWNLYWMELVFCYIIILGSHNSGVNV